MNANHVYVGLAVSLACLIVLWHAVGLGTPHVPEPGHTELAALMGDTCRTREDCNNNGACLQGSCSCSKGFAGEVCQMCAPAHHGYPSCRVDSTCYAISWESCGTTMKLLRNEGLLPNRPKRQVSLVPARQGSDTLDPYSVLGVQVVEGLWGRGTVSLKLCHVYTCGPDNKGGRRCKWENATHEQIYLRNTGCSVDVVRKPGRATNMGSGYKGECKDAEDQTQLICTLPSKRFNVFVRDVSWYMEKDGDGNFLFEAANWRDHYMAGVYIPVMKHGKPHPVKDGRIRLHPLGAPFQSSCNASDIAQASLTDKNIEMQ